MTKSAVPENSVDQFYLHDDLHQTKIVILICVLFNVLLMYGDFLNFGVTAAFYEVVSVRTAFFLASLLCLIALRQVATVRQHNWLILFWLALYMLMSWYVIVTRPPENTNFAYIDTLVVMTIFVVFPCKTATKGVLAAALTCGDLAVLLFFKKPLGALALNSILLGYLLANVLGYFVARRLEQFRRKHYDVFLHEYSLRKALEIDAFTDFLTGAFSRRKFFQLGALEFERKKGGGSPFSVMMLDLDFFKNLNDEHGHAAGDHYLREIARTIAAYKRTADVLGRLGGEEFALILPETARETAHEFAEKLRLECARKDIFFNNHSLRTTVSIGVAVLEEKDRSFGEVLKRADDALYEAKRRGRDQVRLWVNKT